MIWSDLLTPGLPLVEKLVRTVVVYIFLLVGLRLAGKREMSQLNSFGTPCRFLYHPLKVIVEQEIARLD